VEAVAMSTLTGEGVTEVKTHAADKLLAMRVEVKLRTGKVNDVLNRVTVGEPKPRDSKERCVAYQPPVDLLMVFFFEFGYCPSDNGEIKKLFVDVGPTNGPLRYSF
jgi:hypothetical protein